MEVLPLLGDPDKALRQAVKSKVSALKPLRNRIIKSDTAVWLFHETSLRSLVLWTTGPRHNALERAFLILHGQISSGAVPNESRTDTIVRHYQLGLSPRIKDARSGRSTTNVERVLKGHLDALL